MTFWNLNQFWGLAYPRTYSEFVRFFLDMYRDGGLIPRGPTGHNYSFVMIAAPLDAVYRRRLYEGHPRLRRRHGLRRDAEEPLSRRPDGPRILRVQSAIGGGIEDYIRFGYVPFDGRPKGLACRVGSATLEYAYDDWCLAQMAKALGKEDDYRLFLRRAENYRNLFDRQSGFMRPRRRDGSWLLALRSALVEVLVRDQRRRRPRSGSSRTTLRA